MDATIIVLFTLMTAWIIYVATLSAKCNTPEAKEIQSEKEELVANIVRNHDEFMNVSKNYRDYLNRSDSKVNDFQSRLFRSQLSVLNELHESYVEQFNKLK